MVHKCKDCWKWLKGLAKKMSKKKATKKASGKMRLVSPKKTKKWL